MDGFLPSIYLKVLRLQDEQTRNLMTSCDKMGCLFLTDVEEIITKYTMKMTSTGGQTQTGESLVDGNEDNDVDDEEAGEEDDDFLDEEGKFENAKRKLRMVLCQADFQNLPLLHPDNRVPKIK